MAKVFENDNAAISPRMTAPHMEPLHPQAQEFVRKLAANPSPGWHQMPLAEAREAFELFREFGGSVAEVPEVKDIVVGDGIGVRCYRGSTDPVSTPVVYFHGGGWVLGGLDSHDALCRRLAVASGATLFSVDYRKAPEFRCPAALDDCYEVTHHISEHAEQYDVDRSRLMVAGDSAGGNLAAAVAIRARDNDGPEVTKQILIYPVVTPKFTTASYREFASDFGLTRDAMMFFWESYVGNDFATAPEEADLSKVGNLAGLPPAHVVLASHDVLHDEGRDFADRLASAGVPTTVRTYDGMLHGFLHFAGLFDDGVQAAIDVAEIIRSR